MENDTAWPWAFGARAVLHRSSQIGLYTADDWMTPQTLELKDADGIDNILISPGSDAECRVRHTVP